MSISLYFYSISIQVSILKLHRPPWTRLPLRRATTAQLHLALLARARAAAALRDPAHAHDLEADTPTRAPGRRRDLAAGRAMARDTAGTGAAATRARGPGLGRTRDHAAPRPREQR